MMHSVLSFSRSPEEEGQIGFLPEQQRESQPNETPEARAHRGSGFPTHNSLSLKTNSLISLGSLASVERRQHWPEILIRKNALMTLLPVKVKR
jgi:hypothetical protein